MNLHDYLTALRKHWLAITILTVLGAGTAYGYSQLLPDEYRAEASVMVIPVRGDNTNELVQGSNYVQNLVQTYSLLATSPVVLDAVIEELELDETSSRLARRVRAEAPLNTVVIDISATDTSPEGAQSTANSTARQLAAAVAQLSPQGADERPAVRVETIAPARLPTVPVSPNTRLNVMLGLVAGAAVGVAYALFRRRFGTRIASAADVADITDAPVIGDVATSTDGRTVAAALRAAPDGRVAESLRQVTAGFKFIDVDRDHRVVLITSGSSSEGKTSIALSLALTLAEVGHHVLFVEADLRRASVADYTGLEGAVGLTTVIIGEATLAEAVQQWGHPRLDVLTSGALPPNPGQLLASGQLRSVVDEAREEYDYVLLDTAPVLSVSDALWLAPISDGMLFVVRANRTRRDELRRALAALQSTRKPVLGIVMNDVKSVAKSPYYAPEPRRGRNRRSRPERTTGRPADVPVASDA